ncbi:MAG: chaperone modulatory protein CbpM [Solirubrobacteraceae bacterium]|jgi:DNA-binding transcriptional MerR regulator|nr:chaperone modulatory protein CbpM [Solirubrobacteraceae bacterium]
MAVATPRAQTTSLMLVRRASAGPGPLMGVEAIARRAGLHPALVRAFADLGLIEPQGGTKAQPLYTADTAALLARAARLRRDLGIGFAGAVLACELLARIDDLQERLRRYEPPDPASSR